MEVRAEFEWQLRTRTLPLARRPRVMGILNVTPDSFSDGARLHSVDDAVEAALGMFADGASIVDVGGESTRPGASGALSTQQEMDRVLPVIEAICHVAPHSLLSVDTYRAATARAAVHAGAQIVNDVSGLLWDDAMAASCAELGCGVVLMHTRGRPGEWRTLPPLATDDVLPLVQRELGERLAAARSAGIEENRIVLDPGFGFGKSFEANYPLLRGLPQLRSLGRPILAGVSRKAFLGRTLSVMHGGNDAPVHAREEATLAASTIAMMLGASLVRVHHVRPAAQAAVIVEATLAEA